MNLNDIEQGTNIVENIYQAICVKNNEQVKLLLEHDLAIDERTTAGITLLEAAIKEDNEEIVRLILEKGANVNLVGKGEFDRDWTPLQRAITYIGWRQNSNKEIVKLLVAKGAILNFPTVIGSIKSESIVLYALGYGSRDLDIISFLVDQGAKLDIGCADYAISVRHLDWLRFILERIDLDINDLFHKAVREDSFLDGIRYLLDKGADINASINNKTPLQLARDSGTIKLLIEKGANPYFLDKDGNNLYHTKLISDLSLLEDVPLHITNYHGHNAIKTHLIKGNYEYSNQLYKLGTYLKTDLLNDIIDSLIYGFDKSIEKKKYQAIIHLMDKAGIDLPIQLTKYINDPKEYSLNINDFDAIYSYMHILASSYIAKAKEIFNQAINTDNNNHIKDLIDKLFSPHTDSFMGVINQIKAVRSNNNLAAIDHEFDAYFTVYSKITKLIDHDYTLEVLALDGFTPETLQESEIVYRGISGYFSEEFIYDQFKYGHRAFSGDSRFLGFYVGDGNWHFGGTYVSLRPGDAAAFAFGWSDSFNANHTSLILEMRFNKGSLKICDTSSDITELVTTYIESKNIKAIYKVKPGSPSSTSIDKIYTNPYYELTENELKAPYNEGGIIDRSDEWNTKQADRYINLKCDVEEIGKKLQQSYEDFLNHYPPAELAKVRQDMYNNFQHGNVENSHITTPIGSCNLEPIFEDSYNLKYCMS